MNKKLLNIEEKLRSVEEECKYLREQTHWLHGRISFVHDTMPKKSIVFKDDEDMSIVVDFEVAIKMLMDYLGLQFCSQPSLYLRKRNKP